MAFVGSSGEGKSTIFKLLCGFYQKQSGNYKLYGRNFEDWNLNVARDLYSLVSQNVFLFPESIADNVAYGREGATMEEIKEACRLANIHDFIISLPQQYDTLAGERGTRLSGGERQRISIARAFLKNAPILLLDEPTSAIDVGTEDLIKEAIERISQGKTVITIAHRLSTIENADSIMVLSKGQIVESGTNE
ncbi:ATP-binding cassette domain-containing protein, partial [Clostridium sp. CF012]|uniref:ABC transporter ATP-binding protein n=1 Tax=Clostridium sp. CF012 TaxID=2843319 RepID=UPI002814D176